ncbi:hypothetical protein [Lactococcus lactis]|uniref:hypothetical protein n=1 Tax=Lactococcus lactis TaxID=1358 RepID=UPI0021A33652|nr:hypothetical protein [Lactococcus lactis]
MPLVNLHNCTQKVALIRERLILCIIKKGIATLVLGIWRLEFGVWSLEFAIIVISSFLVNFFVTSIITNLVGKMLFYQCFDAIIFGQIFGQKMNFIAYYCLSSFFTISKDTDILKQSTFWEY